MTIQKRLTLADKINTIVNHVRTSAEQTGETLPKEAQFLLGTINVGVTGYRASEPQRQAHYLNVIADSIENYEAKHGITNNLADPFATLGAGLNAIRKEINESSYLFPEPDLSDFEKMLNDQLDNAESVPIHAIKEQILTMYRGNADHAFYFLFGILEKIHGGLKEITPNEESGGIKRE